MGKEKVSNELGPRRHQYHTKELANKFLSDVMTENRARTSIGRKLRKRNIVKDQVLKIGVLDMPEEVIGNKRKTKLSSDKETNKEKRDVVEEPIPKFGEGPGSHEKVEKE